MPRYTARERRERYLREYEFQKRTGKQFFPYAVWHDALTSLIVVGVIVGMAILWHAQFHGIPTDPGGEREGGILGPAYEARANPGVEGYDPRPEWYFFFLFELLRIFKTPELLLFGSIIIPTILMVLLLGVPFIDRRPERRVSRRPFAVAMMALVPITLLALTWSGSKAPGVTGGANGSTHPGAQAFAVGAGCGSCHTLQDAGTQGSVGPKLDAAKPDYKTALGVITNGRGAMPSFKQRGLSDVQIQCLAGYVATWAGATSPSAPGPNAASAKAAYPASCTKAGGLYAGGGGAGGSAAGG